MGSYCGKGLLYFYNLIFVGISAAVMYLSILYVRKWGDYSTLAAGTYSIVPAGLIFLYGILVFITGVVGFCGTCQENRCTLAVFFSLLAVLLSLGIVAASITYKKSDIITSGLKKNLWNAFRNYDHVYTSSKRAFDKMQKQLKCCGVTGPINWNNASHTIPESCCIHRSESECFRLKINVYSNGCYEELVKSFYQNLKIIFGVVIAFGVMQFFGLVLAVSVIMVLRRMGYARMSPLPRT